MNYIYKAKTFRTEKEVTRWLNNEGIAAEDILTITAYCEDNVSYPTYTVFYKKHIQ